MVIKIPFLLMAILPVIWIISIALVALYIECSIDPLIVLFAPIVLIMCIIHFLFVHLLIPLFTVLNKTFRILERS